MALDNFFGDSPNYINPDYITDAQRKQQRTYAEMLMKRSSGDVTRPAGAVANIIDALTGRLEMNRAGNLEQQALSHSTDQQAALIAALQNGGGQQAALTAPPNPPPVASTPPMGSAGDAILPPAGAPSNAPRAEVQSSPKWWGDKEAEASNLYDKPTQIAALGPAGGSAPSGGAQAPASVLPNGAGPAASPNQRVAQAFDPRLMSGILNNQMSSPEAKAMIGQLIGQKQGADVYGNPTRESLGAGGVQALPVGPGVTPGYRAPETVGPAGITTTNANPAPGYGGQAVSNADRRGALAAEQRGMASATALNDAQTGTTSEIIKSDAAAGYAAPEVKKALGVQKQNIERWGHLMTFGPAGDIGLKAKEALVNAGIGGGDLAQATAAAESVNKMGTQLAGALAKTMGGGRTENEYFNLLKSVPGLTGSQQGALAMNDIMGQTADKQQQLLAIQQQLAQQGRMAEYPATRQKFFAEHPIVNPITGHDIQLDFAAAQKQGNSGGVPQTATNPQTGQKIKLENGKWVPMQ